MAESTLAMTYDKLAAEVGRFLGYGPGENYGGPTWGTSQLDKINAAIESGLRQFYTPPRLEGERIAHVWSFLTPTGSFDLASGESTIDLPDDFGGIEGSLNITSGANRVIEQLDLVNDATVRRLHAENDGATGSPQFVALRPLKGTDGYSGQRFQLHVWPTADQAYVLECTYYVLPDQISAYRPYPYGGAEHAETILAACKMAAEETQDDTIGVWAVKFQERLAASVDKDRTKRPALLGYNGDGSVNRDRRMDVRMQGTVTFNGVQY